LPGNLNCTESAPFNTPILGAFAFETGPGATRAWLTTSSCELAVPFDFTSGAGETISYSGQSRSAVPTKHTIAGSFTRYTATGPGAAITSFKTNYTSAALRIGDRLVVATSNLQQGGASPVFNPGTVLFFTVDDSGATTAIAPASPFFALTTDPNPVALTELPGGRVAVTNAGIFDAAYPPLVTGNGSVDVLDVATGALVGSIPLGPGNPGGRALALDPTGSVALAGSPTHRRLYALDVRGLDAAPAQTAIDARLQRLSCNDTTADSVGGIPCLRSRAVRGGATIALPAPPGSGAGAYSPRLAGALRRIGQLRRRHVVQRRRARARRLRRAQPVASAPAARVALRCRRDARRHGPGRGGRRGVLSGSDDPARRGHVERARGHGRDLHDRGPERLRRAGAPRRRARAACGDFDATACRTRSTSVRSRPARPDRRRRRRRRRRLPVRRQQQRRRARHADVAALRSFLAGASASLPAPQKCDVGGGGPSGTCNVVDATLLRRCWPPGRRDRARLPPFLP
jgi:hypothetical protein